MPPLQTGSIALLHFLNYFYYHPYSKLEKVQFHNLLLNYTALTTAEAKSLILLEKEFPYSQVIHGLAARATQDNQLPEKEDQLHLAAIYTTDRAIFKSIMTAVRQERKELILAVEAISHSTTEVDNSNQEIDIIATSIVSQPTKTEAADLPLSPAKSVVIDDAFYEEIQHDLDKLKELKLEFEATVKSLEDGTLSATSEADTANKKKRIIDPTDELLTEIKSSKKKIKPEGPKQKEQIEIIDQFIKIQPTIKGVVTAEAPNDDLSEKNLSYNENIISETLAEILIKQGKREKAIEVLKKLIWKFPQKKAYFAAQIEDLKK